MKVVALVALLVVAAHSAHGLAQLRTVRREQAVAEAAPAPAAAEPKTEWVMAELKSEADSISEDSSNDASAAEEAADSRVAGPQEESLHEHFQRFTKPMDFLPNDHVTLVEVEAKGDDEEGGADKGSNPTYILPVDPFNYFPFFNGFSNVNPFSQFYPPAPYLYPQYTNYMHQYANHGAGHPPGYPYPGSYGGLGQAYGHGAHAGFPYNYPQAHPHMHYPFGAYKLDVSGPDVRTGTNNPPPFPQFLQLAAEGKLITPEIIPKSAEAVVAAEEDGEEEGDTVIAAFIETAEGADARADAEDEGEDEGEDEAEVEFEAEDEGESEMAEDVEIADESEEESEMAEDVEMLDEQEEGAEDADNVEYMSAAEESNEAEDVEYVL